MQPKATRNLVVVRGLLQLVTTDPNAPSITIRSHGQSHMIPLTAQTRIIRGADAGSMRAVGLRSLHQGDHVIVQEDAFGNAMTIKATF
jgi:hypothetical protein